jgi:RHS repeat-associated protein
MAVYQMTFLYVSLNLQDTPLNYTPPVGPPVNFTAVYNQAESHQPPTFYYSNLGQKWTCYWITYINDNPTSPKADVLLYVEGGGTYPFTGFDPATQSYVVETLSHTRLLKTSAASYELQYPDGSKEEFALSDGSAGTSRRVFLTQLIDPAGNALQFNYDSSLRLTNVLDAIGQATSLAYTNPAYPYAITAVTDPFGRTAHLQYDTNGLLAQITDVMGYTSQFTYGPNEFISALTTPYGTTTFTNGQNGGATFLQATDPLGQTERLESSQSYPIPYSDPLAIVPQGLAVFNEWLYARNSFFWDRNAYAQGHGDYTKARIYHWCHTPDLASASRVYESVKAPLENRVWYTYPGQAESYVAAPGMLDEPSVAARVLDDGTTQIYHYGYNALGNKTNSIDPLGRTFSYIYSTNNVDLLEVRMTHNGKNELQSRRTYNTQHLPLTVTDAAGQTTTNTYNSRGQLLTKTDPLGDMTSYSYDPNGYLLSTTGPLQNNTDITSFTYDGFGRLQTTTDTEGYTLTYDYDAFDRKTRTTYPDGTYEQNVYDRLDLGASSDRLGRWTTYTHNADRQLAQTQDPLGRVTTYEWCRCGALTSLVDPMGRQTTWRYDAQSRPVAKQYPDGSTVSYTYENTTSRLHARTDEKGQQALYEYYADNNLKRISYPNAMAPTPPVTYVNDPDYNRVVTTQDGIGTTMYAYYAITAQPALGAGRLASVAGPLANSLVTYQYDALGRVASRAINGVASATRYDVLGRAVAITNALGAFQYSYVGATPRRASEVYPNGQTNLYAYYDNLGDERLQQILDLKPDGSPLSSFGYAYNAVGRILFWTNVTDTAGQATWTFEYDAADQVTNAVLTSGATVQESHAYGYDRAGNRRLEQMLNQTNQYAYNALNQLAAGPVAARDATYQWDAENRLAAVANGNQLAQLSYDIVGRLAGIRQSVDGLEVSNRLFLQCYNEICEERTSAGAVSKRFFEQGVTLETGGTPGAFFYTRDHLGSVRELTDAAGNLVARYAYDPFGRQAVLTGNASADFGFAGMFWAPEAQVNVTRFRAYSPGLGRWLSRDPLRMAEVNQGANLYVYAHNDPLSLTDPLGLICENEWDNYKLQTRQAVGGCLLSGGLALGGVLLAAPTWGATLLGCAGALGPCALLLDQQHFAKELYDKCLDNCK